MEWTDARVENLKSLWGQGLSCSHIAMRLGGVSRNAVIGKVRRLHLPMRANTPQRTPTTGRKRAPIKKPTPSPVCRVASTAQSETAPEPVIVYREVEVPIAERKSICDLEPGDCRWPIGDPQKPDFHFCNGKQVPGMPYCYRHCRVAFVYVEPKRRKFVNAGNPKPVPAERATTLEEV